MILMKQRNGQLNAILEGEKLSVSLSASLSISLDDPQSAKQTNVIIINDPKQWADNQMQDSNAKS